MGLNADKLDLFDSERALRDGLSISLGGITGIDFFRGESICGEGTRSHS